MIKVKYKDRNDNEKIEFEKEGSFPEGVEKIEVSYDGGKGFVSINENVIEFNSAIDDFPVSHKGINVSIYNGRFYCYSEGHFEYQYSSAGSDFSVEITII